MNKKKKSYHRELGESVFAAAAGANAKVKSEPFYKYEQRTLSNGQTEMSNVIPVIF